MKGVSSRVDQRLHTAAAFESDNRDLRRTTVRALFDLGDRPGEGKMEVGVDVAALRKSLVRAQGSGPSAVKTRGTQFIGKRVQEKVARRAQCVPQLL